MSSKSQTCLLAAFARRYPHKTHKIYFTKRTLRGATYTAEAYPLNAPVAELHSEVLAEIAMEIYKAGWQDARKALVEKLTEAISDDSEG